MNNSSNSQENADTANVTASDDIEVLLYRAKHLYSDIQTYCYLDEQLTKPKLTPTEYNMLLASSNYVRQAGTLIQKVLETQSLF